MLRWVQEDVASKKTYDSILSYLDLYDKEPLLRGASSDRWWRRRRRRRRRRTKKQILFFLVTSAT